MFPTPMSLRISYFPPTATPGRKGIAKGSCDVGCGGTLGEPLNTTTQRTRHAEEANTDYAAQRATQNNARSTVYLWRFFGDRLTFGLLSIHSFIRFAIAAHLAVGNLC